MDQLELMDSVSDEGSADREIEELNLLVLQLCRSFLDGAIKSSNQIHRQGGLQAAMELLQMAKSEDPGTLYTLSTGPCSKVCESVVDIYSSDDSGNGDPDMVYMALEIMSLLCIQSCQSVSVCKISLSILRGSCSPNPYVFLRMYQMLTNFLQERPLTMNVNDTLLCTVAATVANSLNMVLVNAAIPDLLSISWQCAYMFLSCNYEDVCECFVENWEAVYCISTSIDDENYVHLIQQGDASKETPLKWLLATIDVFSFKSFSLPSIRRQWWGIQERSHDVKEETTHADFICTRLLDLSLDKHWDLAILKKFEEPISSRLSSEDSIFLCCVSGRILGHFMIKFLGPEKDSMSELQYSVKEKNHEPFLFLMKNSLSLLEKYFYLLEESLLYMCSDSVNGVLNTVNVMLHKILFELGSFEPRINESDLFLILSKRVVLVESISYLLCSVAKQRASIITQQVLPRAIKFCEIIVLVLTKVKLMLERNSTHVSVLYHLLKKFSRLHIALTEDF